MRRMLIFWLLIGSFFLCSSTPTSDPANNDIEDNIPSSLEQKILSIINIEVQERVSQIEAVNEKMNQRIEKLENELKDEVEKRTQAELDIARLEVTMSNTQKNCMELGSDLETSTRDALRNISLLELDIGKWKDTFMNLQRSKRQVSEGDTVTHKLEDNIIPQYNTSAMHQLLKLLVQPTCYAWRQNGFSTSGYYRIDPDGPGVGQDGFMVFCDMDTGFTFLQHDAEGANLADQCSGSGCFHRIINYNANEKQITALTKISESCQQFIQIRCLATSLQGENASVSWWVDRYGNKHDYWSGDSDGFHTCMCGLTQSCMDPRQSCNCNAEMFFPVTDTGYLTNTSILPVTELYFGFTEGENKELRFNLGPLRCNGEKRITYPESCEDLWRDGSQRSGYYFLGKEDNVNIQFCNMEKLVDEDWRTEISDNSTQPIPTLELTSLDARVNQISREIITINGSLLEMRSQQDVLSTTVIFNAVKTTFKNDIDTYILFDKVTVNIGDGYNSTTGKFRAPVNGMYMFSANADKQHDTLTRIDIRRNGSTITKAWSYGDQHGETISCTVVTELEEGDEVGVYLHLGGIYGSESTSASYGGTLFLGLLLHT